MNITYKSIREKYQSNPIFDPVLVDKYAKIISPFFTMYFVKKKITPNKVTLLMIIIGIVGGLIFSLPNYYCKLFSVILLNVWYILDCSDGEVARIQKMYSKFGSQLDYMSHITTHPVCTLAFAITIYQYYHVSLSIILLVSYILISSELIVRHNICIKDIVELKLGNYVHERFVRDENRFTLKRIKTVLITLVNNYPNFALISPVLYFIDYYFDTYLFPLYFVIYAIGIFILAIKSSISAIHKLYIS